MGELARLLLLALLPGVGVAAGGLLAEAAPRSRAWVNWALHAAAGIVIAIAAIEVFPEARGSVSDWLIGVAFAVGGGAYLLAQTLIERRATSGTGRSWMIFLAVAADLVGDGLLIGAGTVVSPALGLTLAIGQILANLPEGFATLASFRAAEVPRGRRLAISGLFLVPPLIAALVGFLVLRDRPETWQYAALVAAAGLYTVAAFEDMIQEAHEADTDTRRSTIALIGGFVLFVFVSAALGG